jgi:hypothetical protein
VRSADGSRLACRWSPSSTPGGEGRWATGAVGTEPSRVSTSPVRSLWARCVSTAGRGTTAAGTGEGRGRRAPTVRAIDRGDFPLLFPHTGGRVCAGQARPDRELKAIEGPGAARSGVRRSGLWPLGRGAAIVTPQGPSPGAGLGGHRGAPPTPAGQCSGGSARASGTVTEPPPSRSCEPVRPCGPPWPSCPQPTARGSRSRSAPRCAAQNEISVWPGPRGPGTMVGVAAVTANPLSPEERATPATPTCVRPYRRSVKRQAGRDESGVELRAHTHRPRKGGRRPRTSSRIRAEGPTFGRTADHS